MCRELRLCKYVENCTVECATSSNFPYGMKGVGVLKKKPQAYSLQVIILV